MSKRIVKNAVVNVGRGVTSAIVAIAVPPILIRHMNSSSYAVWVLILQVVGYMGFIDLGLQTAVGRYIAFAEEKQNDQLRDSIFSTAFAGLSAAATLGFLAVVIVSKTAGFIFPSIPSALLPSMRMALLIAGLSVAIGLPASTWNGVFAGLQRYEIPAGTLALGKLLTSAGLIVAAIKGWSMVVMGLIVATANLLTYCVQYLLLRAIVPHIHFHFKSITRRAIYELSQYCFTLTIWSASTFLIAGVDLVLVGRFEFKAVAPYSAAAVLISFFGGLQVSIFNVIMPHAATLHAGQDAEALGKLLLKATRLGTLLLNLSGFPLVVLSYPIIKIWIGAQYAAQGSPILIVLVIANLLRLLTVPYSTILLGTGQQRLILISPVAESLSNFAASLLLGMRYGAIGVAYGTLLGAVICMLFHLFYNLPRTRQFIALSSARFLKAVMKPTAICLIPFALVIPFVLMFGNFLYFLWWIALGISMLTGITLMAKDYVVLR